MATNTERPDQSAEKRLEECVPEHTANADGVVFQDEYSVFTVPQKRVIVLSASLLGWFSPMTGSIYYPALNQIATDLHVSSPKINLTVTTYLIMQGLAPMLIAGFSDRAGRRPAYMICFVIYIASNIALALQSNYAALLVLRMVQSAGSSGTVALAQGLVGDSITSAERGKYVAFASVGSTLGPTVSPLLGGVLNQYAGWHWIFWFLTILSGVAFLALFLFLPETCRNLVGNGSIPPPRASSNLTDIIRFRNRAKKGLLIDTAKQAELHKSYRFTVPNPTPTLKILCSLNGCLIVVACGFAIACYYAVLTGIPTSFNTNYGLNDLQVSLVFLAIGAGGLVSTLLTGSLVDWNYRRHAKRLNFPIKKNRYTDLSSFPIEMVRLQVCLPLLLFGSGSTAVYGWLLDADVNLAGPIIMLFLLGYGIQAGFQVLNVLMVDLYPTQPAAASAANNFARCLLGAGSSAAIVPMTHAVGSGWAYTIWALIFVASCMGPILAMKYGMRWRASSQRAITK